jgi:Na+/H+ antiporter NhaD/arsenite permease-like protein
MPPALVSPEPWMVLPFLALLGAIALGPLWLKAWWPRHYPEVALGLGVVTLAVYGFGLEAWGRIGHTAVEYVSFVALIGSLFVVSGGILLRVKGEATPSENVLLLAFGVLAANVLGTTGASMLLIRPWLRMNQYRVTAHHVVFFIVLVSNVGGCLTPVGDPPLFLGYLRGVPFWWVLARCWAPWLTAVGLLLALFYLIDTRNYRRAPRAVRERLAEPADVWQFQGLANLGFLAVILGSVFIHHPPFLREALMVGAAVGSHLTTSPAIHRANAFDFHPIREVAILFAGIFATMMPALDWLQLHAAALGQPTPSFFFWATGALSSVLDNAPTYLSFLSASLGLFVPADLVAQVVEHARTHGADPAALAALPDGALRTALDTVLRHRGGLVAARALTPADAEMALLLAQPAASHCLAAISVGAVFFGACTYIGNGPNFMVKAIADQRGVRTPTFPGYIGLYSLPLLLPVFALVWLLYFR